MRKKGRILAIFLIVSMLPFCLISCNRRYDKEEVEANAKILIEKSIILNKLYFGEGIGYLEYTENKNGVYCEADPAELLELGFKNIYEFKQKTEAVFSKAHAKRIYNASFSGAFMQGSSSALARYYQKYNDDGDPECIMVLSEYESLIKGEAKYDYDSLVATHSEGDVVFVKLNVTITYEGKTQKTELEVGLFEESEGWRLETPTYVSYNELQDIYDELQKN